MKILYTSDVHLSSGKKERLKALENVLEKARSKKADILLISGDLFDSGQEAEAIRPRLRKIFSSPGFRVKCLDRKLITLGILNIICPV